MDQYELLALKQRIGEDFLRRRLQQQLARTAHLFGEGKGHLHWENLKLIPRLVKFGLRTTGLLERGRRNSLDFRVENQTTTFDNLPEAFDGYRILHLSDLHLDGLSDQGRSLGPILAQLHYDLCVITGDFRFDTAHGYAETLTALSHLCRSLHCPDGIFAILGNHDFIEMVPGIEKLGIKVLLNEAVRIGREDQHIGLAGIDDPHFYGTHDIARACTPLSPDSFRILLAHSPEVVREAAGQRIDFYLCGHSHAGQICLPGGFALILNCSGCRRFSRGSWRYRAMRGYTSRGTGSSGLAVRFCCPPEITLHRLVKGRSSAGGRREG